MAVTITRSIWIDDDGTGTTGTVINQALHTTLYNEIDTALAKVAQLAGGNTFTGTQTVSALNSASFLTLLTASAERVRILATGEVCINAPSSPWSGQVHIANTSAAGPPLTVINVSATLVNFMLFVSSTGAFAGSIAQTSGTTVSYATTSDARLKHDAGRATDLSALRAVVVHDFTWTADGVRDRGVFAQDAHAHYPRAVVVGTDETTEAGQLARPWMTDYSKFVPDLIVGWQQHDVEIAALRTFLALAKG